jgi:hypothetical protein
LAPRAGNVRQVGGRPAAAGGTAGGAVTASGARSPGPPGGHGHVRVRLVGHGRRTGRRGNSFGARSETTDRSTAVVTGQRDDGRAGGTRPDREPTGPVHPALGRCGPVARHHAEGRAEVVCRGAGPPAGHQAADEQRHAGQRHRQRGPALVRGPCLAPGAPGTADGTPLPPAAASARPCAVRPQGWPLRRGRRRWGRSRSRPRPEWPSGSSGARPATGIRACRRPPGVGGHGNSRRGRRRVV